MSIAIDQYEVDRHAEKQGCSYSDAWRYFERNGYDMSGVDDQYSRATPGLTLIATTDVKRYALGHDITFAEAYQIHVDQGYSMNNVAHYESLPPFPQIHATTSTKEILI